MYENIFYKLSLSPFRQKFKLSEEDLAYIQKKGMDVIAAHARDFIEKRLAPAMPHNDGKQTPMRGHPVFKAQHATACCCRGCLQKWHHIPQGRPLTDEEKEYVWQIIMLWIEKNVRN